LQIGHLDCLLLQMKNILATLLPLLQLLPSPIKSMEESKINILVHAKMEDSKDIDEDKGQQDP
jgi:hypothetical protein